MRFVIFIAAASLLSCGQEKSTKKETTTPVDSPKTIVDTTKTTPPPVKQADTYIVPDENSVNQSLQARYGSDWHVLNDKEASWMKDAFDYFIVTKRKEQPNYPYIAKGDFNGDGKQDTAAVVTDSLKSNYRVAILPAGGKGSLWDEDIMADAAISMIAKGSSVDVMDGEKAKKVKLKNDGINVEYFERASFVLYLDKGKYKRLQTSD